MFHKAVDLKFQDGTIVEVQFQTGEVKQYDMSLLFSKYPHLQKLEDRDFFLSGKLVGFYGIIWDDYIDISVDTIFEDGTTIKHILPINAIVGEVVYSARAKAGISQKELAQITGIDQSDISKIERGLSNPSISTLNRIANALGATLKISIA